MATSIELTHAVDWQAATAAPACLVCNGRSLRLVLDLGRTALANRLVTIACLAEPEPAYPLRLGACPDCGHVQLLDRVPPEEMFTEYLYRSGVSATLRRHFESLSIEIQRRRPPSPGELAVDIGSNDGTLAAACGRLGYRSLGIEPARNMAALAGAAGIEVWTEYFSARTARRIRAEYGPAAVITATNSFPHIAALADYAAGIAALLAPDGIFVIEAHYLGDLLEQNAFDTIYHEHYSYWSLAPMERLFASYGLEVVDVERLAIHHGQLRVWLRHPGLSRPTARVSNLRRAESVGGIAGGAALDAFASRSRQVCAELRRTLEHLRGSGARIAGYGAPAKASTLLAAAGIDTGLVDWIADRNPWKQGRLTPGTHIPIVDPDRIDREPPDYLVLLAWNFADEILQQLAGYRKRGGKIILPLPRTRII